MASGEFGSREEREKHVPVFLKEVVKFLAGDAKSGAKFIDGTLGEAGHAAELLKASENSRLLGLDLDPEGVKKSQKFLEPFGDRVKIVHETFAHLKEVAEREDFTNATGILFDLGMSTEHLKAERGFSFHNLGLLNMRFDSSNSVKLPVPELTSLKGLAENYPFYSAKDIVNVLRTEQLIEIFSLYGEERFSERIAEAIVKERRSGKIETVPQLVEIVVKAMPPKARHQKAHAATKVFQALRIAVNREYETLKAGIAQALEVLASGGKLAVISFHSGEDRIVKQMFRAAPEDSFSLLTKHPIKPTFEETKKNPWSRSAKLRVIEKSPKTSKK